GAPDHVPTWIGCWRNFHDLKEGKLLLQTPQRCNRVVIVAVRNGDDAVPRSRILHPTQRNERGGHRRDVFSQHRISKNNQWQISCGKLASFLYVHPIDTQRQEIEYGNEATEVESLPCGVPGDPGVDD